jgi:hypothetical protein
MIEDEGKRKCTPQARGLSGSSGCQSRARPTAPSALRWRDQVTGFIGRREFGAAAWPLVARAQQAPIPVVGFLNSESTELFAYLVLAFRQGLSQSGYVEGSHVAIEYRWADSQYDRLPALVADLIRREVTVIAANSPAPVMARKGGDDDDPGRLASAKVRPLQSRTQEMKIGKASQSRPPAGGPAYYKPCVLF